MIKIENIVTPSPEQWESIILATRNPMNSWDKSDSGYYGECYPWEQTCEFVIGKNDLTLMKKLAKAGTDHRKFVRMIVVYVDITAPRFWWEQFSTYRVGVVQNSCSTMHTIHKKEFTLDDFSHEHLFDDNDVMGAWKSSLNRTIADLNTARDLYLETKDKKYWYQMIQLLPQSYNQKRTITLNYEVLVNMYFARKDHKLDEWHTFCDWIKTLPYMKDILDAIEG